MKTSAEHMKELENNPEYQAMRAAKEEEMRLLKAMYDRDEKELVGELCDIGFTVNSVWDLLRRPNDYLQAVPLLMKHLKMKHHPKIHAGIARALAMRELRGNDELWELLVDLYLKTPPNKFIDVPCERGFSEGLAVALEANATKKKIPDLQMLIEKQPYGDGMIWLKRMVERSEKSAARKKQKQSTVTNVDAQTNNIEWLSADEIKKYQQLDILKNKCIYECSIEFDLNLLDGIWAQLNSNVSALSWLDVKFIKDAFNNLTRKEVCGVRMKTPCNDFGVQLLVSHIDFDAIRLSFLSKDTKTMEDIEKTCNDFIDKQGV